MIHVGEMITESNPHQSALEFFRQSYTPLPVNGNGSAPSPGISQVHTASTDTLPEMDIDFPSPNTMQQFLMSTVEASQTIDGLLANASFASPLYFHCIEIEILHSLIKIPFPPMINPLWMPYSMDRLRCCHLRVTRIVIS